MHSIQFIVEILGGPWPGPAPTKLRHWCYMPKWPCVIIVVLSIDFRVVGTWYEEWRKKSHTMGERRRGGNHGDIRWVPHKSLTPVALSPCVWSPGKEGCYITVDHVLGQNSDMYSSYWKGGEMKRRGGSTAANRRRVRREVSPMNSRPDLPPHCSQPQPPVPSGTPANASPHRPLQSRVSSVRCPIISSKPPTPLFFSVAGEVHPTPLSSIARPRLTPSRDDIFFVAAPWLSQRRRRHRLVW
jgi:hypothetical protein